LSCATSELASNGDGGMRIELDKVPLRDPSLRPEEILMSESQERMMAVVEPARLDEFLAITGMWDVEATVLGEVTEGGRLVVTWHGEVIVDVPPRSVAHDGPVYQRPLARPPYQDVLVEDTSADLARPTDGDGLRHTLVTLLGSANLADKSWVTDQYDRYVMGNTALSQPDDAGVVRVDELTGRGVALSTDCNGRYCLLSPYDGAQLALAEAYRNVATAGARPLAVTDCLNFGSPEDPGVMWQFRESVRGIAEGCKFLGIPVTGGNVSFYNQTGDVAIHPTPVVGVLGVMSDVSKRPGSGFHDEGAEIYLLGATHDELDGSEWAHVIHGHLGGLPPRVDLAAEMRLGEVLIVGAGKRLFRSAHDLSQGGLAIALAESVIRHGVGAHISLHELCDRDGVSPFAALFSESTARAVVSVREDHVRPLAQLCAANSVHLVRVGDVRGPGTGLTVDGEFHVGLGELRDVHRGALRAVFAS
jgi:phosphoribosylformylglycinamidine synthase